MDILTTGDVGNFEIDYKKLSEHINLRLTLRDRDNGVQHFHKIAWRKCRVEDFETRGLPIDPDTTKSYGGRLCPDVSEDNKKLY